MYLSVTYESEFDDLIMHLKAKYPNKLFDLDGIGEQTDLSKFSKKFFSTSTTSDVSVDANANVDDISVIAYGTELPKPFFRLNSYYMLWKELKKTFNHELANEIIERQLIGDIYINDFHGIGGGLPYCYNYSTYDIMTKGLPMVKKIKSKPPKYLYAFKSQLEQFTIIAANSTLGATGLADMLLVMSYYAKNVLDNLSDAKFKFASIDDAWKYIKENIVSFIYTINQPMRGNQSCFTNISIYDDVFLQSLKDDYLFPDGSTLDIELVKKIQDLFLSIMNEEMDRTPVTFPITTACFAVDKEKNIIDKDFISFIAKHNQKYGFINIYCGSSSTLSSCCRLRSDKENEYFNSFGSGSSKIGSLGVVTINLPRLAFKYKDNAEEFYNQLTKLVNMCSKINHVKRKLVQKRIDNGNHPLYTLGFINIETQYSTVGINGFNECIEILGENILEETGIKIGLKIIQTINNENDRCAKKFKTPHNCEQIPAESVSVKLANKDKLLKIQDKYDIYSNQFIPLTTEANILDRIKLQGIFDGYFSGGAIAHINVDSRINDPKQIETLIETCAKMGVVYFAINYVISECTKGHISVTNNNTCSQCNENIMNKYTRVVGFLTNTKNWNSTRREYDFPNRQFYKGSDV
jgi:ribonucleoside-triphosphate reductase (formate)